MQADFLTSPNDGTPADQLFLHTTQEHLGDDPTSHFWRAFLLRSSITLEPYPVIRRTEHGVWIDTDQIAGGSDPLPPVRPKFMIVGSNSSWAKPTRELAIASLLYRTIRRAERVRKETDMIRAFARSIPTHFPEDAGFSRRVFLALGDKL